MPVLPLGMACIAAAAQNAGHEVKTLNLMMQTDVRTPIATAIKAFSPEVIGISVRNIDDQVMETPTFLLDSVRNVVSDCRSLSNAPIVLGGAGYSIFPKTALAYLGADMGIQGEGEAAFLLLLERLSRKTDLSGIPGLYLPESGPSEKPPEKPMITRNLDTFPIPLPNIHLISPFRHQRRPVVDSVSDPAGMPHGLQLLFHGNHRGPDSQKIFSSKGC